MTDKEAEQFSGKWAVVTVHPSLPSKTEQIARARAWGVTESMLGRDDISAMILDDVAHVGRTTNWMGKLVERASFIEAMQRIQPEGDQVWFADPLCVGFSARLAQETITDLWDAGMQVYVHSLRYNGPALYVPGDDLTEFLESVSAAQNAAHQRANRARS